MNESSENKKKKNNEYSDSVKWTIAAYAPTLVSDGLQPLFVGGVSKKDFSSDLVEKELKIFRENWGIIDKETAYHTMIYLYNDGGNFLSYKTKIGALINEIYGDRIGEKEKDEKEKRKNILKKTARIYTLQRYPEVGIVGNDLTKGLYFTSCLYLAGIYSFEEAMTISIKMAKKAQNSFKSWDEYMENAFWGAQCEFGSSPYDSGSSMSKRRNYYYNEREIKNGIYVIDWKTPLIDEWKISNVLEYPDTIKWFNAAKALLHVSNGNTPHLFPMGLMDESSKQSSLEMLESGWGIRNRKDANETIHKLSEGKMHNERFLNEYEYIKKNANYNKKFCDLVNLIVENYGDRGILAWDLYRAMYLISACYTVGFYTYEESLNKSLIAAKKIQENFDSWDDYMNNYFLGYQYWSRDILKNPLRNPPLPKHGMLDFNESGTAYRKKLYQWLKNDKDSVYNISWNTELKKEW
ncbi:YbeU/YbeR family protein [Flavobacterium tyrosinilyticum]|uniref:DUF1266 domain-containing protein n=1 Tax=Flavobacterium tyrosinilyticum TaxID=1658740 RepID=UPI00203027F4|nr:YbeU/YbeR family protein [Flavobacterium tyrosinilyticum]MCM0665444.1 DUF1266 domain-containing protein [Flavobacterium tyrosinilyticum]